VVTLADGKALEAKPMYTPRMLMVVFGAGASYDSSPTYTPGGAVPPPGLGELGPHDDYYRPPLAKDLFSNRPLFISALEQFPECKTIVHRLRDPAITDGHESIEARLQEIEQEAKTYFRGRQELAAVRCYLQCAVWDCELRWRGVTQRITNYLALLREIDRLRGDNEPVCLVTFNYDTLLEDALEILGHRIRRMEDYTDGGSPFRVFKLHGSVNWAQRAEIQLPPNISLNDSVSILRYQIANVEAARISDNFALVDPRSPGVAQVFPRIPVGDRFFTSDAKPGIVPAFPAIAIPVERKTTFQCPRHMIKELAVALPGITKVVLIGWRATEEHFLKLLKQHLRPGISISVVSGDKEEAERVRVRINRALFPTRPDSTAEPAGFTDFIRSRRAEAILAL